MVLIPIVNSEGGPRLDQMMDVTIQTVCMYIFTDALVFSPNVNEHQGIPLNGPVISSAHLLPIFDEQFIPRDLHDCSETLSILYQ